MTADTVEPPKLDGRDLASSADQEGSAPRARRLLLAANLVALIAFGVYVAAGYWFRYEYNFVLGDALARTGDAKFMILSRDPHAAAIGLYWMPLPTVVQVPLVAILQPFGRADFAGPLSTAFWGAGTVLVIGRMARDLGLRRLTGVLASIGYAFNPVVIYYAANGMSEGAEFFFTALTLWGLLRFISDSQVSSAAIAAAGLAGLALSKYEAVPALVVAAVAVCLIRRKARGRDRLREAGASLFIVVGPAVWLVLLWLCYQYVITGDFFAFRSAGDTTQGGLGGGGAVRTGAELVAGDAVESTRFAAKYILAFFPFLVVLVPVTLWPPWRRALQGASASAIGGALVAGTAYLLYLGGTYGNPRYFVPVIPVGAALTLLVASRISRPGFRRVVADLVIVASFVAAGYTGALLERDPPISVEAEARIFGLLFGDYQPQSGTGQFNRPFQELAVKTDQLLEPGDRVLLDTRFTGLVHLFSRKPRQFIITADRDYLLIVSPQGINARFEYAVAPPRSGPTGLPGERDDVFQLIERSSSEWTKVFETPVGAIWKRSAAALEGAVEPPRG